jgi:urease accessory protein
MQTGSIMLRASAIVRKAAVKPDRIADTAWLDHQAREGRPGEVRSHGGIEFVLGLGKTAGLNDGDAVKLEDGRLIQIRAAPESLLEIRAENSARLMRLAWHLGQRHATAEITAEAIYVEDDPALAELARGQGCSVAPMTRAFRPERADGLACEHHDHGHADHRQGHHPEHHAHDHSGHEHGPACSHHHHGDRPEH